MDGKYLAGFIDGEGCFNVAKDRSTFFVRLLIGSTNLEILEKIKEQYGGDIQENFHKKYSWKHYFIYRSAHNSLKNVLADVKDYLVVKKQQADLAEQMLNTARGEHLIRLEIKKKMNKLNKRGV